MSSESFELERRRIESVYATRQGDAQRYHWSRPEVQLGLYQLRRAYAQWFRRKGGDLSTMEILDVGCGEGGWLRNLLDWGASPSRLHGVELQRARLERARELAPHLDFRLVDGPLPFADGAMDLVCAHTVFSSIPDAAIRQGLAAELRRVARPGGLIALFDFWVRSPRNRDTVGIDRREIARLFPGSRVHSRSLVLAPPIARRLPASLALLVELGAPFLRTHRLYLVTKE